MEEARGERRDMLRRSAEAADMPVLLSRHPYPPARDFGALLKRRYVSFLIDRKRPGGEVCTT
jgi:hypothetical protein